MQLVKIGAAVLNQTPLEWAGNEAHVLQAIAEARALGVTLLCLPELCLSGYGCEDAFLNKRALDASMEVLHEILPATEGMLVSVGLPVLYRKAVFNTACLVADARIAGFVGKRFLAGDGIHYEPRWFKAWPSGQHAELKVGGAVYPIGDLYFDCAGVRVGFEICEDAWVAKRPGGDLSLQGVDVILNPSASHFAFGKHEVRKRFVLEGSRAFGVTYVYANAVGNEAGRAIYDGGVLIAAAGEMMAIGPRFTYRDAHVTSAVVDVDLTRMKRAAVVSFEPDLDDSPTHRVEVPFAFPLLEPVASTVAATSAAPWELGGRTKEEELARAVALGLFDYLRKSRSEGFVVSLSGGADSSAVATLVGLLVAFGVGELGFEAFRAKLGHGARLARCEDGTALLRALLLCVYQATENSGETTRTAARTVAGAVGADFLELDVDGLFKGYVGLVERAIGRRLDWKGDDIALQNIQARVRGPSVWLLANLRNALLLATSNRSEAAVGYATMDGDTCGGLSPIAGIDKNFLRAWLRWMEKEGPAGFGPLPALSVVNEQAPTAELRPPGAKQTDEDDLMPYDVLDAIERLAIRDKQAPLEVYLLVRAQFPQHSDASLATWVERFFGLWCRNQWKRERYAPSFHLDDENLDPKTWCRFPILSGGFERELADLRAHVARQGA